MRQTQKFGTLCMFIVLAAPVATAAQGQGSCAHRPADDSGSKGVAEHVRVRLEVEAGAGRGTLDHPGKAGRGEQAVVNGDPRSLTKTNGDVSLSRWSRRTPGSRLPLLGLRP